MLKPMNTWEEEIEKIIDTTAIELPTEYGLLGISGKRKWRIEQLTKLVSSELQQQRNEIKNALLQAQFYNPGVTRYLKLTEKEIDDIINKIGVRNGNIPR